MVRNRADGVAERASVEAAVSGAQTEQSYTTTDDRHVITGNQLTAVLVPREGRRRRGRRLAEYVDRVALALDQQAR